MIEQLAMMTFKEFFDFVDFFKVFPAYNIYRWIMLKLRHWKCRSCADWKLPIAIKLL